MRSRFAISIVILVAGISCGPISDLPSTSGDDDGPSQGDPRDSGSATLDAGSPPRDDAGLGATDAGAGGHFDGATATPGDGGGCALTDAAVDAQQEAGSDAVDAATDAGDAAADAGVDPDGAMRPAPPWPSDAAVDASDAAVDASDAGTPDAAADASDAGDGGLDEAQITAQPCL